MRGRKPEVGQSLDPSKTLHEGERGTENPNQQTSPVSNVSARVSDNLSPTKQEKDQKGWCREHIWSILW